MAIVEDKRGMQIGNMPSVDAVSQEGFIIYSDDGIHTYKMTIAEFAQAIGVVMTGGGDGDGEGEGLAYWIEDARRIYRDLMMSNENEFRTIIPHYLPGYTGLSKVFNTGLGIAGTYSITHPEGYTAYFGEDITSWYYDWHGSSSSSDRIHGQTNAIELAILQSFRYPALNESLEMPDSKYYCNHVAQVDKSLVPWAYVSSEYNYSDVTVNPDSLAKCHWSGEADSSAVSPYSDHLVYDNRYFKFPKIDSKGQDRRFFGYINLNVNRTVKIHNHVQIADNTLHGKSLDELDTQLAKLNGEDMFEPDDYPFTGTAEYIFSLYCIGNTHEKVKGTYTHSGQDIDFEYYPFVLAKRFRMPMNPPPYNMGAIKDGTSSLEKEADPFNRYDPNVYYNCVTLRDNYTGAPQGSVYRRPYKGPVDMEEYDPDDNPRPYRNWDGYDDKSDIGGAYFEDEEGVTWFVMLTPRTRAARSFSKERQLGYHPPIITDDPSDFDKAPSFLDLGQTFDHWCYDGDDSIGSAGEAYIIELAEWDGDAWTTEEGTEDEKITVYHRKIIPRKITLNDLHMYSRYYTRIQEIGKSILKALGLKAIKPLLINASGIHSEISATPDTVLNGGVYMPGDYYERTYNLDAVTGSLYLKGDVYDNGKKASDKFQEKLTPGENITIERDENDDLVISSSGGGSGSELTYEFDSSTKQTTISGLGDKDIHLPKYNGMYFNPSYGQRSGKKWIELQPKVDVGSMNSTIEGTPMTSTDPADSSNKLYLDIKETYRNNTQRRITGGKHVWLNTLPNTDGNTPSGSGTTSVRDQLYTDCIDTIKVDGVALTKYIDNTTGSYYVDIPSSGGGAVGNPFTYKCYGGSEFVISDFSTFTSLGTIPLKGTLNYDGYSQVHVEVAFPVESTDTIAVDSLFAVELRPAGVAANADIVEDVGGLTLFEDMSCFLTDTKRVIQSASGRVWNKIVIDGVINYNYAVDRTFSIRVKHNTGLYPQIRYTAGITFVPKSS